MSFKQLTRNIERKHLTPLSKIEAPIIEKLVRIYPKWVTPDILTYSALFISLSLIPIYYLVNFDKNFIWLASLIYFLHWLTDGTDGALAYYRKIPRPNYGNYIDHVFDNIALFAFFFGLGLSPILSMPVAIALLIVIYLWNIQASYLGYYEGTARISSRGFGGTEGRLLIVLMQTHWFFLPNNFVFGMQGIELSAWIALLVIGIALIFDVGKNLAYLKNVDESALRKKR